MMYKDRRNAK